MSNPYSCFIAELVRRTHLNIVPMVGTSGEDGVICYYTAKILEILSFSDREIAPPTSGKLIPCIQSITAKQDGEEKAPKHLRAAKAQKRQPVA